MGGTTLPNAYNIALRVEIASYKLLRILQGHHFKIIGYRILLKDLMIITSYPCPENKMNMLIE